MKKNIFVKTLLVVFALLLLSACDSPGDTSSDGNGKTSEPDIPPTPIKKVTWGEAKCQTSNSCDNIVLNMTESQWEEILIKVVNQWQVEKAQDPKTLQQTALGCGATFYSVYNEDINQDADLSNGDRANLVKFAEYTLSLGHCQVKDNLKKNMDSYLQISI